jgi:Ni,Fe-hydrogenase III small subunit/ferredoxin-like protein FixX
MLEWVLRGLRRGRVTTGYPRHDEEPFLGFRGRVEVLATDGAEPRLADICPTGAIGVDSRGRVVLDRAGCILCGACVHAEPERFAFRPTYETAARTRAGLVAGAHQPRLDPVRQPLGKRRPALRRSVHVRHVDAGSDGSEEWEIQALSNPHYDVQRLGIFFTSAPRHADILLVTGGVTAPMREPLLRTWDVMPAPKAVVAVGSDACSGGLTGGGVDRVLPVDVYVPGSPPSPIAILDGILLAMGARR